MMRIMPLALTAALAIASVSAEAATPPSVPVVTDTPSGTIDFTQTLNNAAPKLRGDVYYFTLAQDAKQIDINLTTSLMNGAKAQLFDQSGTVLATASVGNPIVSFLATATEKLLAGEIFKLIVSSGKYSSGASYDATVSVSAVPLPAALPMFGAALIGAAAISRRRKSKKI